MAKDKLKVFFIYAGHLTSLASRRCSIRTSQRPTGKTLLLRCHSLTAQYEPAV
jgi:hypothetical protein